MNCSALAARSAGRCPRRLLSGTTRLARAFTLIEMLVSLTITLMMMGAVVTLFGTMTDSVSGSRALIETSDRLRACRNRLQADLQGVTATMQPPLRPENDEGYFELIEGPNQDRLVLDAPDTLSIFGDTDDVLMFTVRSRGEPFMGKLNGTVVESQTAEVMYFAIPNGLPADPGTRLYTLYRRTLLVAPGLRSVAPFGTLSGATSSFYDNSDVSAHVEIRTPANLSQLVPNTLGDLTKRENRFAHFGTATGSGFAFDLNAPPPPLSNRPNTKNAYLIPLSDNRLGDDVMLTNVCAFDVQVFDPNAPVRLTPGPPNSQLAVTPTDNGFGAATILAGKGAYVDLGSTYPAAGAITDPQPLFNAAARRNVIQTPSLSVPLTPILPGTKAAEQLDATWTNPDPVQLNGGLSSTYDTWSMHSENDGVDQDGDGTADEGANGLDDNDDGIVDDMNEFDARPPFAAPLRGIRVTVRVYEPSTRQVRQITVVQDFVGG